MNRIIDSCSDIQALRDLAKQCFAAWQTQKSAAQWILHSTLPQANDFRTTAREMTLNPEAAELSPSDSLEGPPSLQ